MKPEKMTADVLASARDLPNLSDLERRLFAHIAALEAERDEVVRDLVNVRANRDEADRQRRRLEDERDAFRERVTALEAHEAEMAESLRGALSELEQEQTLTAHLQERTNASEPTTAEAFATVRKALMRNAATRADVDALSLLERRMGEMGRAGALLRTSAEEFRHLSTGRPEDWAAMQQACEAWDAAANPTPTPSPDVDAARREGFRQGVARCMGTVAEYGDDMVKASDIYDRLQRWRQDGATDAPPVFTVPTELGVLIDGFADEVRRAEEHHANKGKGGMSAPFHGDFASVPPSSLGRLRWWASALKDGRTAASVFTLEEVETVVRGALTDSGEWAPVVGIVMGSIRERLNALRR